jgi:hypothetical protein
LNYITQVNNINNSDAVVKDMIDKIKDPEVNVLNNDLASQDNTFKSRLEEKRRKKISQMTTLTENANEKTNEQNESQLEPVKDTSLILNDDIKNCNILKLYSNSIISHYT